MITISELSKSYGTCVALDSVSLAIPDQSIFALVGPNGAGKSTLLKILTQILGYDSGSINYGKLQSINDLRRHIGYLPEQRGLYESVDIETQLLFFASIRGLSRSEAKNNVVAWLKRFEILNWRNKKVSELSKGMQQKVQLISCLVSNPTLVFMDEPLSGIDPVNFRTFTQVIKDYQIEKNAIVLLSTHNMKSVEEICTDVAFLNKSQLTISGRVNEVKKQYARKNAYQAIIRCDNSIQISSLISSLLMEYFTIDSLNTEEDCLRISVTAFHSAKMAGEIILLLSSLLQKYDVIKCSQVIPSMEEIFIELASSMTINNN